MGDMLHDFGVNKLEKLRRSRFDFNMRQTHDQRQGALVPLCWHMVTPSEVWSCKAHSFNRLLLTLAKPLFADVYFTYGFYFVPLRILFKDYEKMFGDGSPTEWINPTEYVIPSMRFLARNTTVAAKAVPAGYDAVVPGSVSVDANGNIISQPGNLANYLGLPVTVSGGSTLSKEINPAPFLAYERIWTDMFRDENYQNEDPDLSKYKAFNPGSNGVRPTITFGLHYANRFHDYFSSLLPNTQKGPSAAAFSHLITLPDLYSFEYLPGDDATDAYPIMFGDASRNVYKNANIKADGGGSVVAVSESSVSSTSTVLSTNLGVDISVEKLRMAFATQRARERNARCGSRFVESMLGTFEAHLSNGIAQRAEFLGGNTIKLNITSVPSTSEDAPGKLGAFSATRDDSNVFIKQFNEPGIVMAVGTYRIKHRYSQGVDRQFDKLRRYDSYDPAFAHISEQPHTAWELCPINTVGADTVIGFNEPWVEDIKPIDRVCGQMGNPSASDDFKAWVPVDNFLASASPNPYSWLPENGDDIAKRCIDYNSNFPTWVFGTDFIAECKVTSPRPIYSIPGFIDHLIG